MAQAVGTPALVLAAWVAAGVVAMLGALCFAELGALLPDAGGEYVYLRAAFGEVPGFLYACNSFVLGGASIAAYGAAVAIFISDIHPFDTQWFARSVHLFGADYTLQLGTRQLVAIGVIAVFAAINCAGVMLGGRVQTALTVAKVAAIVAVAVGVFGFSDTGTWANLTPPPHQASGGLAGFGAAMFAALWAYSGWQYLPMAASEVQNPERNLPRAIIGGSLLVLAIYLAVNAAYLYALPVWQVASASSTAYPEAPSVAARAVQTFLGSRAAPVAALVFLISTVGSLNGTILARARVSYASARDGAPHPPRVAALSAVSRAPPALGRRSRPPSATLQLPEREGRSAAQPEPEARLAEPTLQPHAIPVRAPQVDIGIGAQRIAVALEIEPGQGAEVEHAAAQPAEVLERALRRALIEVLQHVVADHQVKGEPRAVRLDPAVLPAEIGRVHV